MNLKNWRKDLDMASRADVIFAQLQQDEANRLQEEQRKQQASLQK